MAAVTGVAGVPVSCGIGFPVVSAINGVSGTGGPEIPIVSVGISNQLPNCSNGLPGLTSVGAVAPEQFKASVEATQQVPLPTAAGSGDDLTPLASSLHLSSFAFPGGSEQAVAGSQFFVTVPNNIEVNPTAMSTLENLETALSSTFGTHGRCPTLPQLASTAAHQHRPGSATPTSLPQATPMTFLLQQHYPSIAEDFQNRPPLSPLNGCVPAFHVGTPPTHYSDVANQAGEPCSRDVLDHHPFSPTTSYSSEVDIQVC